MRNLLLDTTGLLLARFIRPLWHLGFNCSCSFLVHFGPCPLSFIFLCERYSAFATSTIFGSSKSRKQIKRQNLLKARRTGFSLTVTKLRKKVRLNMNKMRGLLHGCTCYFKPRKIHIFSFFFQEKRKISGNSV